MQSRRDIGKSEVRFVDTCGGTCLVDGLVMWLNTVFFKRLKIPLVYYLTVP